MCLVTRVQLLDTLMSAVICSQLAPIAYLARSCQSSALWSLIYGRYPMLGLGLVVFTCDDWLFSKIVVGFCSFIMGLIYPLNYVLSPVLAIQLYIKIV